MQEKFKIHKLKSNLKNAENRLLLFKNNTNVNYVVTMDFSLN